MDIQISAITGCLLHSNTEVYKSGLKRVPFTGTTYQDLFTGTLFNVHRFHILQELKSRQRIFLLFIII